jgi:hypothetical protein
MWLSKCGYQNVAIKMWLSKCGYQNVAIKMWLSKCGYQNVGIEKLCRAGGLVRIICYNNKIFY